MRVLLLSGTGEGRVLAERLAARFDVDVLSSLARRVAEPLLPPGQVRIGGFGGVDGLASHLETERIDVVIDATHPFAARITTHAAQACDRIGVPLLVLRRPGWTERDGDRWRRVPDMAAAARGVAVAPPGVVLLTVGRREPAAFAGDDAHAFVIRSVEPPDADPPLPPHRTVVLARGPFTADDERALFRTYAITMLVTKDSGGDATAAKLTVAREVGVPVVMIDRPQLPPGVAVVASVDDAVTWATRFLTR